MQRLCERPGCGAASDASYGIDRTNLVVWIDRPDIAERETAGRLCRRHANALMVPRGWTLDDRREPVPRLFRLRDEEPGTPAPRKTRSRGASPRTTVDTPSLFESIRREVEHTPIDDESYGDGSNLDGSDDYGSDDAEQTATSGGNPAGTSESDSGTHDPEETRAIPWSPRLSRSAADDTQERPRFGRLLGRAFGEPVDGDQGDES